jgi:hypothetical protein
MIKVTIKAFNPLPFRIGSAHNRPKLQSELFHKSDSESSIAAANMRYEREPSRWRCTGVKSNSNRPHN